MSDLLISLDFDRLAALTINARGQVVQERDLYLVRPYTSADRELALKRRGRDGFSYGKAVCLLPSARFAARDRNRSVATECETYRDEED